MVREEEVIQSKCTQWFWNEYPHHRRMLFHVDNNSWNAVVGAKKKALGVVAGVSDLVLILESGRVLWLECKKPGGEQTQEQIDFQIKVENRAHIYLVFSSFEQFKELIWKLIGKN